MWNHRYEHEDRRIKGQEHREKSPDHLVKLGLRISHEKAHDMGVERLGNDHNLLNKISGHGEEGMVHFMSVPVLSCVLEMN